MVVCPRVLGFRPFGLVPKTRSFPEIVRPQAGRAVGGPSCTTVVRNPGGGVCAVRRTPVLQQGDGPPPVSLRVGGPLVKSTSYVSRTRPLSSRDGEILSTAPRG